MSIFHAAYPRISEDKRRVCRLRKISYQTAVWSSRTCLLHDPSILQHTVLDEASASHVLFRGRPLVIEYSWARTSEELSCRAK